MDIFDFEELTDEILNVTDEQREDDDYLPTQFYEKFNIEFDEAYEFAKALLMHTVPVGSALTDKQYHAFISRKGPVMLMKTPAKITNKRLS